MEKQKEKMSKKKIIILIIVILGIMLAGLIVLSNYMMPKTVPIEESTTFTKDELEVKCLAVVFALNMEDYEALQQDYADETMKEFLTKEKMDSAKEKMDVDWKANVSFGDASIVEMEQSGKLYAVAQLPVTYGDKVVTYTLTFDTDYKLAGLYMK